MNLFYLISAIVVLSAVFAYINHRLLRMPTTVGLMIMGLAASLLTLIIAKLFPWQQGAIENWLSQIDFSQLVLNFLLSFLLFAGALHSDFNRLRAVKGPILTFATLGILLSTFAVGSLIYYLLPLFSIQVEYLHCLLFGALISPTDPIAVLGILRKAKIPKAIEAKITGESLINDGIGVVIFVVLLGISQQGVEKLSLEFVGRIFLEEVVGGLALGGLLAFVGYRLMKSIDHYQTEVLITLALVLGGYSVAQLLHFSGPLAMVVCGLFIGSEHGRVAMSDVTTDYVHKFWEILDEILNAFLFLVIGLEILLIDFGFNYIWIGLITALLVLIVRYLVLAIPSYTLRFRKSFAPNTLPIMTWGGLKGGISIALALSLSRSLEKDLFTGITYVVVLFSIIVQGLSMGWLIDKMQRHGRLEENKEEPPTY